MVCQGLASNISLMKFAQIIGVNTFAKKLTLNIDDKTNSFHQM